MFSLKKIGLVAMAGGLLFALGLAACSDDDDNEDSLVKTQVLAAMVAYRAEGMHTLDEEMNAASGIDAGWSGTVTRLRQVTAGVDWPDDLADSAQDLEDELTATETALDDEDLSAAKEHITGSHTAWHGMEHDAYAFIAGEEPSGEEEGDGHDEEESTGNEHDEEESTGDGHDEEESPTG